MLTLDQLVLLADVVTAHGIAIDEINSILFVADRDTTTVRFFRTSDWSEAGQFSIIQAPAGIAVDAVNQLVYTGTRTKAGMAGIC